MREAQSGDGGRAHRRDSREDDGSSAARLRAVGPPAHATRHWRGICKHGARRAAKSQVVE